MRPAPFLTIPTHRSPVRGNNDSTLYEAHTRPFPFPQPGYLVTPVDGYALCRYYECSRCEASPEFVAVHHECFEIFSQRCTIARTDAMRRLWVLAAWRRPWRRAQPVYFPAPTVDKDILATVSSRCGLPLLHTLPTEILDMIRAYSPHSLLWRCLVVLELADFVSTTDPQPLITLPVREIQSWHRNGTLQRVTGPPSQLPILITVDSTGVSKIERLPVAPTYAGECSTWSMFALLYPSLPAEFVAHSKVCLATQRPAVLADTDPVPSPTRTVVCVSPFLTAMPRSRSGTPRALQAPRSPGRFPPTWLRVRFCARSRWTISRASPFSSPTS